VANTRVWYPWFVNCAASRSTPPFVDVITVKSDIDIPMLCIALVIPSPAIVDTRACSHGYDTAVVKVRIIVSQIAPRILIWTTSNRNVAILAVRKFKWHFSTVQSVRFGPAR
jgi:hypothetical protein